MGRLNIRLVLATIAVAVCALCAAAPVAAQQSITVTYDDGRPTDQMRVYHLPDEGDAWFLHANDVARLFRATQFWNASSRKVVLGVGRTRFVLTVDTRVVVIDGEPIMLRTPILYDEGFVMVPLEFILEIASHYTPRTFTWDEARMTLDVQGLGYNVGKIEFSTAQNRTTATISLDEPLLYHMDSGTPGLVRLKLYGGRVDTRAFEIHEAHGLIEGVRAEQTDRDAYVYFDIKKDTRRIRVEREKKPDRLVLILEKGELPEIPEVGLEDQRQVQIIDESSAERRSFKIEKVVLDPGHGGKDTGKVGPSGLMEKDVNLALARVARDAIQSELGLDVVLTRDDDELIPLERRTEIANEDGADLFISIHCNSWFSERTGGFEAYFLSPARSESERALARYENASGNGAHAATKASSDIDFILWDLVQNRYINESSTFAEYIQRAMEDRLHIRNRGVKQANFVVLQGAKMPAVLIETAFLSNPDEERMLADPDFQHQVAEGIVDAIRRMQEHYKP